MTWTWMMTMTLNPSGTVSCWFVWCDYVVSSVVSNYKNEDMTWTTIWLMTWWIPVMNGNMNYDMDNDNDIDSECWFLVQCVVLITMTSGKKKNEDMAWTTIWLMSWWIPVMNGRSNMNHDMDMNDDKNIESSGKWQSFNVCCCWFVWLCECECVWQWQCLGVSFNHTSKKEWRHCLSSITAKCLHILSLAC